MSAVRLREAAKVLRARADDAACAAGTAWRYSDIPGYRVVMAESDPPGAELFSCDACRYAGHGDGMATTSEECAHYIATMDPDLGVALAESLDQHAEDHSSYDCRFEPCAMVAVANAILGGA